MLKYSLIMLKKNKLKPSVKHGQTSLRVIESVIKVIFQNIFYLKIHQNNIFFISSHQNNLKILKNI
jgi:hypothetical protein